MVCPESVSLLLLQIFGAVNMFFRRDLFLAALQPSYRPDRWVASAEGRGIDIKVDGAMTC